MKKCPKCNKNYEDNFSVCPDDKTPLISFVINNPDDSIIREGVVLLNKYKLIKKIGEGGMGVVYEAEHLKLHKKIAIKFLLGEFLKNVEALQRFEREAEAAASIDCPNVVQIYDIDKTSTGCYIVMEYLEGEELRNILDREKRVSLERLVNMFSQIARALDLAHSKGIIHRDLKPENLFIIQKEEQEQVKILDFGISKIKTGSKSLTQTGAILGTPYYMSPEQAKGDKELDHRTDIYSLGAILYECITGKLPIESETVTGVLVKIITETPISPRQIDPDIPESIESVILKAMSKNSEDRYQSCTELALYLAEASGVAPDPLLVSKIRSGNYSKRNEKIPNTTPMPQSSAQAGLPQTKMSWNKSKNEPAERKSGKKLFLASGIIGIMVIAGIVGIMLFVFKKEDKTSNLNNSNKLITTDNPQNTKQSKTKVLFNTDPREAEIYYNGTKICITPCQYEFETSLNKIEVEIKKDGYNEAKKEVLLVGELVLTDYLLQKIELQNIVEQNTKTSRTTKISTVSTHNISSNQKTTESNAVNDTKTKEPEVKINIVKTQPTKSVKENLIPDPFGTPPSPFNKQKKKRPDFVQF